MARIYTRFVKRATFSPIGDGCQVLLFDEPRRGVQYLGMIVTPIEMTIHPGMRVELEHKRGGYPHDGHSLIRYRFDGGPWIAAYEAGACKHSHPREDWLVLKGLLKVDW